MIKESELFFKYKSSYTNASFDFFRHMFFLSSAFFCMWYLKDTYLNVFTVLLVGLLNIKTFTIFHDCGHNSYTPNKTLNYVLGTITGTIVYTPFCWSYLHNTHHLTNGNVDNEYQFSFNELVIFTLNQYKKMTFTQKRILKVFYSPYILFTVLSYIKFLLIERVYVVVFFINKYAYKPSTFYLLLEQILNNIGVFLMIYIQYNYSILWQSLLAASVTSCVGSMLFFNQHTYNPPYVTNNEKWTMKDSGLKGSSFIQIPKYLKYFTGSIEYHHVHHMISKIPGYNLQKYHEEVVSKSNMFDNIVKLSISKCYQNLWLSLYDEDKQKFITFTEADSKLDHDDKVN